MPERAGLQLADQLRAQQAAVPLSALALAAQSAVATVDVVTVKLGGGAPARGFGAAGFQGQHPVVAEAVVGAQQQVVRLAVEYGPARCQALLRVGQGRQGDAAVAGFRHDQTGLFGDLLAVVFDVGLQVQALAGFPVQSQAGQLAPPVDAVDGGTQRAADRIDAHPVLLPFAEAAAQIGRQQCAAVVVQRQPGTADRREAGALAHQVDDAGRGGEAVVQRRHALQDLDPLLVFQRGADQVDQRQRTIQPIVAAVFQRDAANGKVIEGIAGQLLAGDTGGIAQRVMNAGGGLRVEDLARDHVDGGRYLQDGGAAEGADFDRVGEKAALAFVADGDVFQRSGRVVGHGGGREGQAQRQQQR